MPLLQELASGLSHLFFPQLCEGCRCPLLYSEKVLCLACMQYLPRTGFHHIPDNEAALRLAGRIPYSHATAFAHFTEDGLLQHLLHRLKYANKRNVGLLLGEQLGHELKRTAWAGEIDALVPVPLHPKKEAARGYNQSALIAEGIAQVLGLKVLPHALRRSRPTESQTRKSRGERVANVKDAFVCLSDTRIRGRHILLLDDVLTTGATLEAAAQALLRVPGIRISVATIGMAAG